jgi:phosphatidylserine/phosphatidylglycerophosphate/cardiolipin synthase-like enzyme
MDLTKRWCEGNDVRGFCQPEYSLPEQERHHGQVVLMAAIVAASAYANNEVVYVAWDVEEKIDDCLGFDVTRVYLNPDGTPVLKPDGTEDHVRCASWLTFENQKNTYWLPQDTSVWPIQRTAWRDLTVRKKRDNLQLRPSEVYVRYEIRPVGDMKPGLEAAPDPAPKMLLVTKRDSRGMPVKDDNGEPVKIAVPAYEGTPRPLGYLGPAVSTAPVLVTSRRGKFQSTFTNGILAAQWLSNVLLEDGKIEPNELINKISDPDDPHRKYLAGDVLPLLHELFSRKGEFYLALYELEDRELEGLLLRNAARIHIILSNTGERKKDVWDERNAPAREALVNAQADIQHRMFNNGHIGHNKFVVHIPPGGGPRSVFTGSTNWTMTGIAGQTNNAILIEDDRIAGIYLDYWQRLKADVLPEPEPLSAPTENVQGPEFRTSNEVPGTSVLDSGAGIEVWFSPNTQAVTKGTKMPPDLNKVFERMKQAEDAILFLAFYPSQRGKDSIVGKSVDIAREKTGLIVNGAVSSSMAMPNYVPKAGTKPAKAPYTFFEDNIAIVRAANIDDRMMLGDFKAEQLAAMGGIGAIIHDKIVVIDPLSPECTVILGSHNLGFKASYENDEQFVMIRGDQALAQAYAVHVLDVYDHYRYRAVKADRKAGKKKDDEVKLAIDDSWMEPYISGKKSALIRYFAHGHGA